MLFFIKTFINFPLRLSFYFVFFFPVLMCTNYETSFYTPEEANTRIAAAFLINDSKCNMGHNIILPIIAKVEKKGTDLCVLKILSLDCTAWGAVNPAPEECAILLTSFK